MRGITKRYPGVVANDDVDLEVGASEIVALLGENGAGKSTLMKVLYGLERPDEGTIEIDGAPVELRSPAAAIAHGVGMIHQHFMLVDALTVADNVTLGTHGREVLTSRRRDADAVSELAEYYGLDVDPRAFVWQLSVGERQRVEILKALHREARILVLDEPTAVLTPQEADQLFVTLRRMAADGRGLIFISHKLHEVLALADRVVVMRGGRMVGGMPVAGATRAMLAEMMVGRSLAEPPVRDTTPTDDRRLVVRDLTVTGDRGQTAVRGVSLAVRRGEILGLAGVSGNGQRELAEAVTGLRPIDEGMVQVDGTDVSAGSPSEHRHAGLAYVPEERMREGAIATFSVAENLVLIDYAASRFCRSGWLRGTAIERHSAALVRRFGVRTPSVTTALGSLSGGNIQKVIMARELAGEPGVLIAAQPTRGVDVGAAEQIHAELVAQRDRGTATLLISEDLDEIFALADRIAVICDGVITGEADPATATAESIGLLMAGVSAGKDDGDG